MAELQLLAVSSRHARRGLGTLLLAAVERWLVTEGVKCIVALAGLDTLGFWRKRGYSEEGVTLPPAWWALLRDPFGHSQMLAKWTRPLDDAAAVEADAGTEAMSTVRAE